MIKNLGSTLPTAAFYPFRFEPIYKDYLWGGNRFQELFHRPIPEEIQPVAESWEISDHPHGMSVIQNGQLRGFSLHDVLLAQPQMIFGDNRFDPNAPPKRFPLILKYLDASKTLSVQVHPDDHLAEELGLNDSGKTEAWIVVDAQPKSSILVGTQREYSPAEQERLIRGGDWETLLNRVEVKIGDCFFVQPGTLHALGEGVVVAEIQTTSDLTFRMFDWNRLDKDGKPRELKIEEGIRALRNPGVPVFAQIPSKTGLKQRERLIIDEHFTIDRWAITAPTPWYNDNSCHILTVLEGAADISFTAGRRMAGRSDIREADPEAIETLHRGDSILIPSACRELRWIPESPRVILLDIVPGKIG